MNLEAERIAGPEVGRIEHGFADARLTRPHERCEPGAKEEFAIVDVGQGRDHAASARRDVEAAGRQLLQRPLDHLRAGETAVNALQVGFERLAAVQGERIGGTYEGTTGNAGDDANVIAQAKALEAIQHSEVKAGRPAAAARE